MKTPEAPRLDTRRTSEFRTELLERARDLGVNAIAMDMVPRISRAQKMDALSSMANIAGSSCGGRVGREDV